MTIECSRCGGNHMRSECPTLATPSAPDSAVREALGSAILALQGILEHPGDKDAWIEAREALPKIMDVYETAPDSAPLAARLRSSADHDGIQELRMVMRRIASELERSAAPSAPDSADPLVSLVDRFAKALLEKLQAAEQKYGYRNNWMRDGWQEECQQHLIEHLGKGDPRDVAAYCAFLWHHDWPTIAPSAPTNIIKCCYCGGENKLLGDECGGHPTPSAPDSAVREALEAIARTSTFDEVTAMAAKAIAEEALAAPASAPDSAVRESATLAEIFECLSEGMKYHGWSSDRMHAASLLLQRFNITKAAPADADTK